MIYDIKKNASTTQNTLNQEPDRPGSDDDWDEFTLSPYDMIPDETVLMKCERCGYEEEVPLWVLEELAEADGDKELSCCCMKCSRGTMHIK